MLFILLIVWRSKKLRKLGDNRLVQEQLLGFIPGRETLKFILLLLAFASLAVGWANLQKINLLNFISQAYIFLQK